VFLCAPFTGQSSPPCSDLPPERLITNGGFFLPTSLIRSIFLRPLAPRALPRFCAVGSEEAHLAALASVRRSNWTCRFPASSFHRGEHLLGCKEGIEWTFLSPSGLIQSASLLGRTGSGFSLRELSSCLTLLICPSGSFLLPLSVAFPNFL
jgi:hypothetical protein